MKKYILVGIIIMLSIIPYSAFAQRYLPGQMGIQVTGGLLNGDYHFGDWYTGVAYSRYTRSGNHWVYGAEFLNSQYHYKNIDIPINAITAEGGYYLKILSDRRHTFFLSIGFSAIAGYETINWGEKRLSDGSLIENKDKFIYGGAISMEIETYLNDRIVLLLQARERILGGSDINVFTNQIGIGLKYIL